MKTKELIRKIENEYAYTIDSDGVITIRNAFGGDIIATVSKKRFGIVNTFYSGLKNMVNSSELSKMLLKYALTPLDEREDEPRFYIRMIPKGSINNWDVYLNLNKEYSCIFVDDSCNDINVQTIFTKPEYEKLWKKYPAWLPKFDKNDPHFEIVEGDD